MNPTNSRTLILQGHSRPIKDVKFSNNGEFIFSASSDRNIFQWNTNTGEKVMSFYHMASVNSLTTTSDGIYLISGDTTGCVYIWELKTGKCVKKIEYDPDICIRSLELSTDNSTLLICYSGRSKTANSFCHAHKLNEIVANANNDANETISSSTLLPFKTFQCVGSKYLKAKFTNLDKTVLLSREDGYMELLNYSNGATITKNKFHEDIILNFDVNTENGLILTAGRDGSACVINFNTFELINKFNPPSPTRNLNACAITIIDNPDYNSNNVNDIHGSTNVVIDVDNLFGLNGTNLQDNLVKLKLAQTQKTYTLAIVAGGQDNKLVTTTNQKEGGFEIVIFNTATGVEFTNFLVHFGPVNALSVKNNLLASGGEDATVRLHKLDKYLFQVDKNK